MAGGCSGIQSRMLGSVLTFWDCYHACLGWFWCPCSAYEVSLRHPDTMQQQACQAEGCAGVCSSSAAASTQLQARSCCVPHLAVTSEPANAGEVVIPTERLWSVCN